MTLSEIPYQRIAIQHDPQDLIKFLDRGDNYRLFVLTKEPLYIVHLEPNRNALPPVQVIGDELLVYGSSEQNNQFHALLRVFDSRIRRDTR